MIHMNMQEMPRVLRTVSSNTCQERRRLIQAATVTAAAPTAELSTRLVTPMKNSPVMEKKMRKGAMPARSSRSLSIQGTLRSSGGSAGPSSGCSQQRKRM